MSLATNITNLATRMATEAKSLRTLLNGNAANNNALTTTAKSNLVAAINEVNAKPSGGGGASIDDANTNTISVWSSSKTNNSINSAVAALVNGAASTLDTLKELADALGGDANYATTTATALGNRVRADAVQSFTTGQKLQARVNIDSASTIDIGDTETNFVATFESGLV